jgi:hypothetical protein
MKLFYPEGQFAPPPVLFRHPTDISQAIIGSSGHYKILHQQIAVFEQLKTMIFPTSWPQGETSILNTAMNPLYCAVRPQWSRLSASNNIEIGSTLICRSVTDWLTDWLSRYLHSAGTFLRISESVKKFQAFNGTRRFITMFTGSRKSEALC